jgi:hypothetical protein
MKQSVSLFKNISLFLISFSLVLASCSKDKALPISNSPFVGQYEVVDDNETYMLKVESKGGKYFQIKEFGGFLNAPLDAVAEGDILRIPSQTFTNPNGKKITLVGTGMLSTKETRDDTITFQYSVSGFTEYSGDFAGTRK